MYCTVREAEQHVPSLDDLVSSLLNNFSSLTRVCFPSALKASNTFQVSFKPQQSDF